MNLNCFFIVVVVAVAAAAATTTKTTTAVAVTTAVSILIRNISIRFDSILRRIVCVPRKSFLSLFFFIRRPLCTIFVNV